MLNTDIKDLYEQGALQQANDAKTNDEVSEASISAAIEEVRQYAETYKSAGLTQVSTWLD